MKKIIPTFRILCIPYIIAAALASIPLYLCTRLVTWLLNKLIQLGLWTIRKIGYRGPNNKLKYGYYPFGIIFGILKALLHLIRFMLDLILLGLLTSSIKLLGPKFSGLASFESYKKRILLRNKLKSNINKHG